MDISTDEIINKPGISYEFENVKGMPTMTELNCTLRILTDLTETFIEENKEESENCKRVLIKIEKIVELIEEKSIPKWRYRMPDYPNEKES